MYFKAVRIEHLDDDFAEWGLYNSYSGGIAGGLTSEKEALDLSEDFEKALDFYCWEMNRQSY